MSRSSQRGPSLRRPPLWPWVYFSVNFLLTTYVFSFIITWYLLPGDGGWGEWSNWTDCTKSCGGGIQSRRRECDSPSPEGEGNYCEGLGTEVIACNTDHCPGMCNVNFLVLVSNVDVAVDYSRFYLRFMTTCNNVCVFSCTMFSGSRHSVQ